MKPGIPWSVKGIEPDAREAAKEAARRRGMTLGAWLNSIILEQSEASEKAPIGHNPRSRTLPQSDDTKAQFDDLADQLNELSRQDQRATASRLPGDVRLSKEFTRILERLDAKEKETAEALAAVNDRLAGIGLEIGKAVQPSAFLRPEDVPGYSALESALRNIIEHIAASEARARDTLQAMQERVSEIASRANPALNDAALRNSATITRIEERIGEVSVRVARAETAARQDLPAATRAELARLAERIDAARTDTDSLMQRELHGMESRMRAAVADVRSIAQSQTGGGTESQRVRSELEGLSQRIDDLKADAASERDLHALRVALEQISARVAQGTDLRPLADMEARLAEIGKRMEHSILADHGAGPQFGELEARIAGLDDKLNRLVAERGELHAWPAIEPQLAALVERLGQTEHQLSHLANLERSIGQLFESVEQSRNWARDVAEEAANRMADRLAGMQPSGSSVPSPELRALVEGLDAMRASATSVDHRNQETFAAIHDAISQIVSRLGEMESVPAAPSQQAPHTPHHPDPQAFLRPQEHTPFQPPHIPPLDSFAPELSKPHVPPLVTPLPDPAQHGDAARPPADDFIAAARRAAQAASHNSAGSFAGGMSFLGKAKANQPKTSAGKGFSLPFARKKEAAAPANGDVLPAPAAPDAGKRRRLIVIGLVLLAAASALAFGTYLRASKPKMPANAVKSSEITPQSAPAPADSRPTESISRMVDAMLTAALPSPPEDVSPDISAPAIDLPAVIGTPSLRDAAIKGNPLAQFIIAGRYLEGRGVPTDPALAAIWYEKAASQGLAPAQYRLGTLYERGDGVPRNMATALEWYERAAEGGNVKAMHNVAVIYAGAQAGTPGYQKAARWFEAAASYGLSDSQYNLAILFERGLGVEKNLVQAMFWYGLAAQQNDAEAMKRLRALSAELPPDLAAKTQVRIDSFIPKPSIEAANRVSVTEADWQSPGPAASIESGNTIVQAQRLLTQLGYDVGQDYGRIGTRTTNAIRLFQLGAGLKVTGQIDDTLLMQLQAARS